jgi:tripartite-type tricarboxylate transporter receptor subunit TctC
LHLAAGAAALLVVSSNSWAQAYPTRPVRLIVPVAAGGTFDIVAGLMGQWLSELLGQQFVIENRPGAGNNVGIVVHPSAPAKSVTEFIAYAKANPRKVNKATTGTGTGDHIAATCSR